MEVAPVPPDTSRIFANNNLLELIVAKPIATIDKIVDRKEKLPS